MSQTNAAKLTQLQVQQVRALHIAGFTTRSIAPQFGVCVREIANIVHGRNWGWLPVIDVPLPILPPAGAERLALRRSQRQRQAERERLDEYRARLAAQIEDAAEREGFALRLAWRIKRPARQRQIRTTAELHQ